ncbi:MAG: hypothetical protein GXO49_05105, partial [Chlorobi bacterium]|nr:hypothetical protein [Chlorobiota bacterium]
WNVDKNLIDYANLLFKKYHGYGIDNTGEEVFYFNEKMLIPYKSFVFLKNIPSANLKLDNSYSYVFNLTIDSLTTGNIFVLKNDSINKLTCNVKNQMLIIKTSNEDSIWAKLPTKKENTIAFLQDVKNKSTTTIKLILNDNNVSSKEIKTDSDLVKFSINPNFNGNIDKIRIYDFILDEKQLNKIKNDTTNSEILKIGNKEFKTLYLWQKK